MNMEWYELSDGRLCKDHPSGFKVIKPADNEVVPLLCPVCEFPMLSVHDNRSYRVSECCEACSLKWVDLNKEDWANGWRPSENQIKQEVARRRARVKSFIL